MDTNTVTRAGRREWIGLAVLALPTLLVSVDIFVMLLALPRLSADLGAGGTEQLWIGDIYSFMLAGFLVTMGTLGDRIGRRKLLLIGAVGFGVTSVVSAYSTSPGMLIVARALLGIAGAALAPSTMALISTMFRDPRQRAQAFSVWMVCLMAGAAIGPLVGGVLLANFWWGSVFLLGVPAMLLLLVLGPVLLPEYRATTVARLDLLSVGLSLVAILPAIYGLKELARAGWHPLPVAALAVGLAFGVLFVRRQRRLSGPLLDLRLFANRSFSAALVGMLFGTMLPGAIMVFITQSLQTVEGLSPLRAGMWMLPAAVAAAVSSLLAPVVARRVRPAYVIGGGMLISALGLLALTRADAASGLGAAVVGFTLMNLGGGPMVVLTVDLIVGSAPPEKAGSAAALNETSGQFGFALGIAALGSIGTAIYRAGLKAPADTPAAAVRAARESIAGASTAAGQLPDHLGTALLTSAREAFTTGMHVAAGISAALLVVVVVLVVALLRHIRPTGRT